MIGPMILSSVQIAAMPIVPAPMKRTLCDEDAADEIVEAGAAGIAPRKRRVVRHEERPADHQADEHRDADGRGRRDGRRRSAAIDRLAETAVAPEPTVNALGGVRGEQPRLGERIEMRPTRSSSTTISSSPRRFSSAPPMPEPTLSTSAAATPSG